MTKMWRQEYKILRDFLTEHPEIVVTGEIAITPEESRADFYSLFNAVLKAVTLQTIPNIQQESIELTRAYEAAAETTASFKIDKTRTLVEFYRFISDPVATVANAAFNPLYDLLKGKVSEDGFEQTAMQDIESLANQLRATVYEKWIILTLVKMLGTQEIYDCNPMRPLNFRLEKFIRLDNQLLANVSTPVKTQVISWEFDPQPIITQPDFILHAGAAGKHKYVAIRSKFRMATHRAKDFPDEGEWVNVMDSFRLDGNFILLYCSDNLTDLALVAERGKVFRPEAVIRYLEDSSKYSSQWLEEARTADAILQPNSGLYIISKAPVAALMHKELGDYMHYIEVGFDQLKFTPIIDALLMAESTLDAKG